MFAGLGLGKTMLGLLERLFLFVFLFHLWPKRDKDESLALRTFFFREKKHAHASAFRFGAGLLAEQLADLRFSLFGGKQVR